MVYFLCRYVEYSLRYRPIICPILGFSLIILDTKVSDRVFFFFWVELDESFQKMCILWGVLIFFPVSFGEIHYITHMLIQYSVNDTQNFWYTIFK